MGDITIPKEVHTLLQVLSLKNYKKKEKKPKKHLWKLLNTWKLCMTHTKIQKQENIWRAHSYGWMWRTSIQNNLTLNLQTNEWGLLSYWKKSVPLLTVWIYQSHGRSIQYSMKPYSHHTKRDPSQIKRKINTHPLNSLMITSSTESKKYWKAGSADAESNTW